MNNSILTSPFARVALRSLGLAPLDREFHLRGGLAGVDRLLLVDSGQLSDVVFFMPIMSELKRVRPDLNLQVMVEERWAELLRRESHLDALLLYKPEQLKVRSAGYFRLLKEIKGRSFDGVVLMGEDSDPARDLVAYASQAGLRLGVAHPERESLLNCLLRWRGQERYKMDLACELGHILGLHYDPKVWRFRLRPEETRAAEQMIHFRKPVKNQILIGFDSSAGKAGHRFAGSNLHYLANHLITRLRAKAMLFHLGETDRDIEAFQRELRSETLDMPAQNLRETLALVSCCQLFVAGNTELFHAAVAMGVPAIGLFTEADGRRWEPRDRAYVRVLRGKAGESLSLKELDGVVEQMLNAPPA